MRVLAAIEKKLLMRFIEKISVRESVRLSSKRLTHGTAAVSSATNVCYTSPDGPLSGIRIIDLTRVLAGPFATMVLSDLGAEVIKIEHPQKGDETRSWGPPFAGSESCYFLSVNRNKQSIAVDLKKAEGLSVIHDLAKQSDVLIENFIPGALDRIGLGYDALKTIAPQLIYCSISGYGPSGPYHKRPGYDVIAASVGGLVGVTGPEDGEPCKVGVAMTDLATGLYAHGAIMAALLDRQRTGNGQKIDCNLLSTQISCMVNLASNYLNGDREAKRWGTAHESIVPYQAFPTSDGYLTIGSGNNDQFAALCKVLDLTNLLHDDRYATNALRVKNREDLLATLKERFQQKTTKEWLIVLEGAPFPYGPINTIAQAFSDPQVIHNEMVKTVHHPTVGPIKQVAPPVSYSSSHNKIRSAPPVLGQHTRYVLSEIIGYSDCKIKQLIAQGAVASSKDFEDS